MASRRSFQPNSAIRVFHVLRASSLTGAERAHRAALVGAGRSAGQHLAQEMVGLFCVAAKASVTVRIPSVRGEIRDRNGVTLVGNRASYEVDFYLPDMVKGYRRAQ